MKKAIFVLTPMRSNPIVSLEDLHSFDNLEFIARQVVEGFMIGLHKSPYHGFSVEFAEHRLYNPGESVKDIDWKVYARTDRMYVKKFEEETNLRCQLVLDISSSMYFPDQDIEGHKDANNKVKFSAVCAASLIYLLKKQRDAFGLTTFHNKVVQHTNCKASNVHYRLVMSYLQHVLVNRPRNKHTAASKCLHQIAESLHKRSLVVIFSDMMENVAQKETDNMEELFSALQHLKYNKHEVVLFHVTDKKHELEFQYDNRPYVFIDLETGERVKIQSNKVKEEYVNQVSKFKRQLELKCAQFRIDFVEADINENFRQVLLPYLMKRKRMN